MQIPKFLRKTRKAPAHQASEDDQKKSINPSAWRRIIGRIINEPYPGAWQQNQELCADDGLSYPVVFACVTRIADDLSKVPIRVEKQDSEGIYRVEKKNAMTRLLRRPNNYQDRQKFIAAWESSIQSRGNAYILKARNGKGDIESLHVLNPDLTLPMVAPSGAVFYQIQQDNIAGIPTGRKVPASEIIHDRINCLFHPLVGLSPLYAAALNVWLGKMSQQQQQSLFANGATPGGVLIFPGNLTQETANEIQAIWNTQYSGENAGKTAVLGDGVKYERLGIPAKDNELIQQLRFGAEMICSVFHVPPFKIWLGPVPSVGGIESLNQMYFSDCLQARITAIQSCLNEAFDLEDTDSTWRFELDDLILMDTKTRYDIASGMTKNGLATIDEGRRRMNLGPVVGGSSIYMQQQDNSLEAIYERDRRYLSSASITQEDNNARPSSDASDSPAVSENIQQEALNGAQVTALQTIVMNVASGVLPIATARGLIGVAFPLVSESQIDEILDSARGIQPDAAEEAKMIGAAMFSKFKKGLGHE